MISLLRRQERVGACWQSSIDVATAASVVAVLRRLGANFGVDVLGLGDLRLGGRGREGRRREHAERTSHKGNVHESQTQRSLLSP